MNKAYILAMTEGGQSLLWPTTQLCMQELPQGGDSVGEIGKLHHWFAAPAGEHKQGKEQPRHVSLEYLLTYMWVRSGDRPIWDST